MKKINLAIIENHKELRQSIKNVLDDHETISVVNSSEYAKDFLLTFDPDITDVVLLDYSTTTDTGLDGLKAIRTKYSKMKIVAMCNHPNPEIYREVISYGANDLVNKHSDIDIIIKSIESV